MSSLVDSSKSKKVKNSKTLPPATIGERSPSVGSAFCR